MGKIKRLIRNLSIRKTFMLFVILFLLLAAAVSAITTKIAGDISNNIMLSYSDNTKFGVIVEPGVIMKYIGGNISYSPEDAVIINICNAVTSFSVPVSFSVCIVAAALLFYRSKLEKPIDILNRASAKIADNDLDFQIQYDSRDEMGQLCVSFEKMRSSLDRNNREMWRAMEERKRLNAAFAHDLRTPLTVLRGYTDFLGKYLPEDRIKKDKIISTVSTMDNHISRLENYVENMYSLQKLDEIEPVFGKIAFNGLCKQLKDCANILCRNIKICFNSCENNQFIYADCEIVTQVFENLISNAVRYAKECITVGSECSETMLKLIITDDGNGFSDESLKRATEPFFRGDNDSGKSHFGIGLNICKILCEKHGGALILNNIKDGGAEVTAVFGILQKFSSD